MPHGSARNTGCTGNAYAAGFSAAQCRPAARPAARSRYACWMPFRAASARRQVSIERRFSKTRARPSSFLHPYRIAAPKRMQDIGQFPRKKLLRGAMATNRMGLGSNISPLESVERRGAANPSPAQRGRKCNPARSRGNSGGGACRARHAPEVAGSQAGSTLHATVSSPEPRAEGMGRPVGGWNGVGGSVLAASPPSREER